VAGIGSAIALARQGHEVTLLERDATPMPGSADEAYAWDRRGAPQVRHSHAFLARLRLTLRDHYPDVLAALLVAGATELRFGDGLPPTLRGFEPLPDDDDLTMLACRRTTFEWVLRRVAVAEDHVELRTGVAVAGLTARDEPGRPQVTGVRLADGSTVPADLTVVASGRRSALPVWLAELGAPIVAEQVEDTGIVYLSRFYRLRDGAAVPARAGAIGGDLGYLKYGVFVGDDRTFSVTLAAPSDDDELRRRLARVEGFEAAARRLPVAAPWLDGRAVALDGDGGDGTVHLMGGLLNRWRDVVVDGEPVATGVVPVGDAVLCTNPLYGRGCSTGFWAAHLLAEAVAAFGDDVREVALAYDASLRAEIRPWYRAAVRQDAQSRRVAAALLEGRDPDEGASGTEAFQRAVLRDGLLPATRVDPVVLRAFARTFNLLVPPDALASDPDVGARVLSVLQAPDERPPEPALGPATRAELLAALG